MNQARIWLVVQPTVGLPLLLGSVTGLSLLVHYAVLSHSTWYADFYQGGKHVKAAAESSTALPQVGELTLPNGAKVKFSIEGGSSNSVAFSTVPESSTVASVAAPSPSADAPPLVRSDSADSSSKSAN
jgi:light-harvesting protein B-800-850 alpha chain